jgi:hypothetical protein
MADQATKNAVDDVARGEILRFLKGIYPQGATPLTLIHYLHGERAISLNEESLSFHVQYLAEEGYASFELQRNRLYDPPTIRLVRITKAGIDRVCGRPESDGVAI